MPVFAESVKRLKASFIRQSQMAVLDAVAIEILVKLWTMASLYDIIMNRQRE
jgi:hypothetical protein